jgi:hypothetical protein
VRKLPLLLLLISVLLLAACGDDSNATPTATAALASSPTATASVSAQTTATTTPAPSGGSGAASDSAIEGTLKVDFTGAPEELEAIDKPFSVPEGSSAWDAVKEALGEDNVSSQDFGGDLGVFVTGFKGVDAEGNHFWEFKVNGESSNVGAGKYEVKQGDVLEFAYSSF